MVNVCKNSGPVLSRLWTKVHEVSRQRRRPFVLAHCLCLVSFCRYSPLSREIVENRTNAKVFCPQFFPEGRPQLVRHIVSAIYRPLSGKVWSRSVCWSLSVKPGNSWMQNLRRVGENSLPIWSRLLTKVHVVLRRCRRPVVVCNALALLVHVYHVSFRRDRRLNLRNRGKKVVFGALICRLKGYPTFQTCIFKFHLLSSMWPILIEFRSTSSANSWRKKKEEERIPGKI